MIYRSVFIFFVSVFLLPVHVFPGETILNGAGATFPGPLYHKWFDVYQEQTGIRIFYQAKGSGFGIKQLLERKVDFGATDVFLSDREIEKASSDILHVPTCLGAVAIFYNLPGNPELRFTPDLIASIFSGGIKNWSDPRIVRVNPHVILPDMEIVVVHRSEGSGTTYIFTEYLSKVVLSWKNEVGKGKIVEWPTGLGVEGNTRVSDTVRKISGSIGYVSLTFAERNRLPIALVRNQAGNFIKPTQESVSLSAQVPLPPDTRILITNSPAPNGYPISAFTYLILYKEQFYNHRSRQRAMDLARFLTWTLHEGQQFNKELSYAPLPLEVVNKAQAIVLSMTYDGKGLSTLKGMPPK